jgi:Tfp pilus assembly pilus retraction ATPase PilT
MRDLDKIVSELNASSPPLRADVGGEHARLTGWLQALVEKGGSDLLLVAGVPPAVRVDGEVVRLGEAPLDGTDVEDAVGPALAPHAARAYRTTGTADASLRVPGLGRFRINLHHERGRAAANIRHLPSGPPRLASLNLPAEVEQLTRLSHGLVLVVGRRARARRRPWLRSWKRSTGAMRGTS